MSQEASFFQLAHQVVGNTNSANLRQMEAASHAVVASYAAQTHQEAVALAALTIRDAGQKMLETCNNLQAQMEQDPLSAIMCEAVYMQAARAVVEMIALAGGIPLDVAAKKAAPILQCEAADLMLAQLTPEVATQMDELKSIALVTDQNQQPPPQARRRSRKALGLQGEQVLQ